ILILCDVEKIMFEYNINNGLLINVYDMTIPDDLFIDGKFKYYYDPEIILCDDNLILHYSHHRIIYIYNMTSKKYIYHFKVPNYYEENTIVCNNNEIYLYYCNNDLDNRNHDNEMYHVYNFNGIFMRGICRIIDDNNSKTNINLINNYNNVIYILDNEKATIF